MSSRISPDDVVHVAELARLDLTPEQVQQFTDHLDQVLDHAADIEALDLDGVPPTSHPVPLSNVLRPDVAGPILDRDEVLAAAPDAVDDRFRVPPILADEP